MQFVLLRQHHFLLLQFYKQLLFSIESQIRTFLLLEPFQKLLLKIQILLKHLLYCQIEQHKKRPPLKSTPCFKPILAIEAIPPKIIAPEIT